MPALTYLGQASKYFGQKTGLRMLKSAVQTPELAVASYLDRVKHAEKGLMNDHSRSTQSFVKE